METWNEIYQDKDGNPLGSLFDGKSFIIHFTEKRSGRIFPCQLCHSGYFQPAIMALCDAGEGKMWISGTNRTRLYDLSNQVSLYHDSPR